MFQQMSFILLLMLQYQVGIYFRLVSLYLTGLSVNDAMKFFVPLSFALVPIVVYFLGRNHLSEELLKYTIIASSLPVIQDYSIWGTTLVFIPYLLLLSVLVLLVVSKVQTLRLPLLFGLLAFAVVTSHAVTSLVFALVLGCLFLGTKVFRRLRRKPFPISLGKYGYPVVLFLVLLFGWWSCRYHVFRLSC